MDRRELADAARNAYSNLKALFTTGYARNAIVHHVRLDPGVELITKPSRTYLSQLRAAIARGPTKFLAPGTKTSC